MERERIGRGSEYTVVKSKLKRPTVLKRPHTMTCFFQRHLLGGIETLREEILYSGKQAKDFGVEHPKTRIFPFKKGYIISQDFIEEDDSVDIRRYLMSQHAEYLLLRYESNPNNFISNSGRVYLVDPAPTPLLQLIAKTRLIKEEHVRKAVVIPLRKAQRRLKQLR